MPALLIYDNGFKYAALCVNTRIEYEFLGSYPDEQLVNVRAFAESMFDREPLSVAKVLDTQGADPDVVVQQLFADNNSLSYQFELVWEAEEGESIMDELGWVGLRLIDVLGGLGARSEK
jgi:hypothetical protein